MKHRPMQIPAEAFEMIANARDLTQIKLDESPPADTGFWSDLGWKPGRKWNLVQTVAAAVRLYCAWVRGDIKVVTGPDQHRIKTYLEGLIQGNRNLAVRSTLQILGIEVETEGATGGPLAVYRFTGPDGSSHKVGLERLSLPADFLDRRPPESESRTSGPP